MSDNVNDEELLDNDPTNELPVLLETVVLDPAEYEIDAGPHDDTGEHTAHFAALQPAPETTPGELDALRGHLEQRAAQISMLERDVERLTERWREVERHLAEREAVVASLRERLEAAEERREAAERRGRAAEERAAALQDDVAREQTRAAEAAAQLETAWRAASDDIARAREQQAALDLERQRLQQGFETETAEREQARQALQAELLAREQQIAVLGRELDEAKRMRQSSEALLTALRDEHAKVVAELEEERGQREAAAAELARVQGRLRELTNAGPEARVTRLQEEAATLAGYIATRRERWEELEARVVADRRRIAELEQELEQRLQRQQRADTLAVAESTRAAKLRAELAALSRELWRRDRGRALEREAAQPSPQPVDTAALESRHRAELAALDEARAAAAAAHERELAELRGEIERLRRTSAAPAQPSAAAQEAVAQLQSALEHERERLAESAATLAAHDARAAATLMELDALRRQLAEARAQHEQARQDIGRLERTLIDKGRALDARDERIQSLQNELDQRLGALQKLNAMDISLQGLDSKMSERLRRGEAPPSNADVPALLCLTSDAPRQYALSKSTLTIGRSPQCDIQIFTQFVSREHARLTVDRGRVMIEDLGSTNGVFVNSVRVERQELRHSDLVTVGETQFRFLERTAH